MLSVFNKLFKKFNPDLYNLLTTDINQKVNTHEISRAETFSNRVNYSQIIGISKHPKAIKRFFTRETIGGLAARKKINEQSFSMKNQSFSMNRRILPTK